MDYQKNVNPETMEAVGVFRRRMDGDSLHIEKWSVPAGDWVDHPGLAGWASAIGGADDFFPITEEQAMDIIEAWGPEEKGSGSSGNWGHRGRPGTRGGSAPGGGFAAIGAKPGMSRTDVVGRRTLTKKPKFPQVSTAVGMAKYKAQVAARNPVAQRLAHAKRRAELEKTKLKHQEAQREAEKDAGTKDVGKYGAEVKVEAERRAEMLLETLGPNPDPKDVMMHRYTMADKLAKEYGIRPQDADNYLGQGIAAIEQRRQEEMVAFAGKKPTAAQVRVIAEFESQHRDTPTEWGWIVKPNGDVTLKKTDGSINSVNFTTEELWNAHGQMLIHNHPTGQSFSTADVYATLNSGISNVVATGKVKFPGSSIQGKNFRHTMSPDLTSRQVWADNTDRLKLINTVNAMNQAVKNSNMEKIYSLDTRMPPAEAEATHYHDVWSGTQTAMGNRELGNLNYEREELP